MANEIKAPKKRGRSNYWIDLVGMERLHQSNAAIVKFQVSARDGERELFSVTLPITVDGGEGSLDATAARACERMGDALHKMLELIDNLRDHYRNKAAHSPR